MHCFKVSMVSKFQSSNGFAAVQGTNLRVVGRSKPCISVVTASILLLGLFFIQPVQGQPEKPPRPIKVKTYQNLSFGSVILSFSGGTVTMDAHGIRTTSGLILPPTGSQGSEATFEVKALPGTLITLVLSNTTISNGSHSMNLTVGPTDPVSPFVVQPQSGGSTIVHVGGTLTVGTPSANPAGSYNGSFMVTFIQQ